MRDVLMILLMLAATAVLVAYVGCCDRIVGGDEPTEPVARS